MKTHQTKLKEVQRQWHLIDAQDKILGKVATRAAFLLQGKHKANFVPYLDNGDYVVIINAVQVVVSGKKEQAKMYYTYSGYPSGLKAKNLAALRSQEPQKIIIQAVKGMLPKSRLGRAMLKKLYVYAKFHDFKNKTVNIIET